MNFLAPEHPRADDLRRIVVPTLVNGNSALSKHCVRKRTLVRTMNLH